MKKILSAGLVLLFALSACDKADDLTFHENGSAPVLTASAASIAPAPADSDNVVLTVNWTDPVFATDSAHSKYVLEIDSVGKGFSMPYRKTVYGMFSTGIIAKDLNQYLVNRLYPSNVPVDLEVRLVASYANNNEMYMSNVLPLRATPYKVPPKVPLPTTGKLFIVGGATIGGWTNPVPTPTQELARLDETTWAGIIEFTGGGQYLLLPENGQWAKYSVANNTLPGLESGGDFGQELADNFPAPSAGGWYKVIVDFQNGKFKVTPFTSVLPTNLYLVGDATPGGWSNPVPVPSQQMTRLNSSQWRITLNFTGSGKYLLLPVNGSWSTKYAVPDNTITDLWKGGELIYNSGQDIPGPNTAGNKTLLVDFATKENYATGKFTVTP